MNKKKILYLGFMPPPIGGVSVLSTQLYNYMKENENFDVEFIDMKQTSKTKYILELTNKLRSSEIVTLQYANCISYFSKKDILTIFLIRLFKKKTIFRCFGGSAHKSYSGYGWFKKLLIKKTILSCDVLLFETKENVNYFKNVVKNKQIEWFPNNKKFEKDIEVKDKKATRYCFFGQIKSTKGIREIYKASEDLNENICIDIYGPMGFDITEKEINESNNKYKAKYKGCIEPDKVTKVMKEYDVLLLPTYHEGEGYPGVILEAYSIGMPVIATNWNSLAEIVNKNNGILIEPKNEIQLGEAMLEFHYNKEKFITFQTNVLKDREKYESEYWNNYFMRLCNEL